MAAVRTLVETEHVALREIACRSPRSGPGPLRGGESSHFVMVRRGAFAAHLGRRSYVADACTALISWEETEYRISHPGGDGDDCVVIELSAELAAEALAPLRRHRDVELRLCPRLQAATAAFAALARPRPAAGGPAARAPASGDRLSIEEASLELMRLVLGEGQRRRPANDSARRKLAQRAVEALHKDLAASPSVSGIAAELGCSPFALMRAVRAELGTSLRGYRVAARVGAALHRLAEGEGDLTRLALELGFSSHAHLTGTFVRVLGAPPSELRSRLNQRARTFLEARRAATS